MVRDARGRLWEELDRILAASHRMPVADVPEQVASAVRAVGGDAVIHVVDLEQRVLVPLRGGEHVIDIDGSIAGRAYRSGTDQRTAGADGDVMWIPMLDGADRHGVVRVDLPPDADGIEPALRSLVTIAAELIVSKSKIATASRDRVDGRT